MRIPKRKLYRAFPELDQFSDAECERYVRQVKAQRAVRRWPVVATGALSIIAGLIATPLLIQWMRGASWRTRPYWRRLERMGVDLTETIELNPADLLILLAFLFCVVAVPALVTGIARDTTLRLALRGRINRARCPNCNQSLLGLPISDADSRPWVRCPECGERHDLAEMSLAPADLIPREHTEAGNAD